MAGKPVPQKQEVEEVKVDKRKKARFKQMIRTISKGQHYDYDAGLMSNEEVEQEINQYLPEWEVKYVDCLDREAPFGELNNAGVEMLYVLVLKE